MSLLTLDRRGSGTPLVWLHGFTQTKVSASQFLSILTGRHEILTLDLPGHGDAASVRATLPETAAMILDVIGNEPVALGGYSLGGRVALHVALAAPERFTHLVTIGATRGLPEPDRTERRERDRRLATHARDVGADAFLDEWLQLPLFATLRDPERASRTADAEGIASSLELCSTGTQEWLGDRLGELTMPVLAIAGEYDAKFVVEATALSNGVRRGRSEIIPGTGHPAHCEKPELVAALILDFLASA